MKLLSDDNSIRGGLSLDSTMTHDTVFERELTFRDNLLAGETALVTGGGTGLGQIIACVMARLGAHVMLCGRRSEPLESTASLIRSQGGTASFHACSIRSVEDATSVIARAQDEMNGLSILINNAGGQFVQSAIDISPKGWNAVIDTNLTGTWNMIQAAAKSWQDTGTAGHVVNVVLDIWRGIPGMAHSVAARAGVIYLSRTLAVEWAPLGIRINCVAPGIIDTPALETYEANVQRKLRRDANVQRKVVDPLDIAEACIYLVSPGARFITGETLTIDGGQQLWGDVWAIPKPEYFRFES